MNFVKSERVRAYSGYPLFLSDDILSIRCSLRVIDDSFWVRVENCLLVFSEIKTKVSHITLFLAISKSFCFSKFDRGREHSNWVFFEFTARHLETNKTLFVCHHDSGSLCKRSSINDFFQNLFVLSWARHFFACLLNFSSEGYSLFLSKTDSSHFSLPISDFSVFVSIRKICYFFT